MLLVLIFTYTFTTHLFYAFQLPHKQGQIGLPRFLLLQLSPTLPKVIPNIFKVNLVITLGLNSFIAIIPKFSK